MKNNNFLFYICFALIPLCLFGCSKREIKNSFSQGSAIICFGDSITFGYGVEEKDSYPVYLSKMLDTMVINAGVDGDTTAEALKRLEKDVLSKNPRLVIVEFGGNDFLKKIPIKETISNLKNIVSRIQSAGAMVAIADISAGLLMREYKGPYKKIAMETGAIFIPSMMNGIITNPRMKSDFFHPNSSGYRLIAERVFKQIKPYIIEVSSKKLSMK